MKKATSRSSKAPSAASLREMPEVDFTKARVRRNPYAAMIAAHGASIVHDGPSSGSLEALPEVDFAHVRARKSPYADALQQLKIGRGRPKKGQELGPSPVRSIRLPVTVWTALDQAARGSNTTVHALLRLAVSHLLETNLSGNTKRLLASKPSPAQRPSRGATPEHAPRRRPKPSY
jgi:hypothetical protein